jgi:hypothetical protein
LSSDKSGCLSWALAIAGVKIVTATRREKAKRTRDHFVGIDIFCVPFVFEGRSLSAILRHVTI